MASVRSIDRHDELVFRASALQASIASLQPAERISLLRRETAGRIVFTTSFGLEDQVITHLICERGFDIDIVTLDTGRLFPEAYALWAETERRYGRSIRPFYPSHAELEAFVTNQGINGFYHSREARTNCCHIRKLEPLQRALAAASAWITGLRGDQSSHRTGLALVSVDTDRGLLKLNPLFDWPRETVLAFANALAVPINPLHAKGFASIGCAPCTRALRPGEPERAGRWWWEEEGMKECGLHIAALARRSPAHEPSSAPPAEPNKIAARLERRKILGARLREDH